MRAGLLRHRVEIQSSEAVQSAEGSGQVVDDWQTVDTTWASIEPITGREQFTSQQVLAEVSHKITLRFREGLEPKMRFVFDDGLNERIFNIETILNYAERGIFLTVLAKEAA